MNPVLNYLHTYSLKVHISRSIDVKPCLEKELRGSSSRTSLDGVVLTEVCARSYFSAGFRGFSQLYVK
jgi:hypothetical protein